MESVRDAGDPDQSSTTTLPEVLPGGRCTYLGTEPEPELPSLDLKVSIKGCCYY